MCSFWRKIETRGLVLSWRRIRSFLLINASCLRVSFWCISSIFQQHFSFIMVLPGFVKLWWIKPAKDHQTVTITMEFHHWEVLWSLVSFQPLVECLWLSYRIHFSQVTIRFRKGSFWFRRRANKISKCLRLQFSFNSWWTCLTTFLNLCQSILDDVKWL